MRCLDAAETLLISLRDYPEAGGGARWISSRPMRSSRTPSRQRPIDPLTLAEVARGAMWRVGEVAAELEP